MAESVTFVETQTAPTRLKPERLAWGVLLIAFAVFCVISVASTIGLYIFLFQSTVPMSSTLRVGQGTIGLTFPDLSEKAVRDEHDLSGTAVTATTDSQTQGTIAFRDPQQGNRLIATVLLKGDSALTLRQAVRPRFAWGTGKLIVELVEFVGKLDVFVAPNLGRGMLINIQTQQGSQVSIINSGRYTIDASETQVQVTNYEGQAILFAADVQENRLIPTGEQGTVTGDGAAVMLLPAYDELVVNSTFQQTGAYTPDNQPDNTRVLANNWACGNSADLPLGSYGVESKESRLSMRLVRQDDASSHGETKCIQNFAGETANALDVSEFDYIALRTTLLVNHQSLSKCGIAGSECPLMLRMDYITADGTPRQWYQGFYTMDDPQYADYPPTCDSCLRDHVKISEKTWYTFETGNLFTLLPTDWRPGAILNIQFYASGHQYDVYLGEMSLVGGQADSAEEE